MAAIEQFRRRAACAALLFFFSPPAGLGQSIQYNVPSDVQGELARWLRTRDQKPPLCGNNQFNPSLSRRISELYDRDQRVRREPPGAELDRVTLESENLIREITRLSLSANSCSVGIEVAEKLLVIAVHLRNLPLRKEALKHFKYLARRGLMPAATLANIEDRNLVDETGMQRYGTQVRCDQSSRRASLYPIINPGSVDEERKELGLYPLYIFERIVVENADSMCSFKSAPEMQEIEID